MGISKKIVFKKAFAIMFVKDYLGLIFLSLFCVCCYGLLPFILATIMTIMSFLIQFKICYNLAEVWEKIDLIGRCLEEKEKEKEKELD